MMTIPPERDGSCERDDEEEEEDDNHNNNNDPAIDHDHVVAATAQRSASVVRVAENNDDDGDNVPPPSCASQPVPRSPASVGVLFLAIFLSLLDWEGGKTPTDQRLRATSAVHTPRGSGGCHPEGARRAGPRTGAAEARDLRLHGGGLERIPTRRPVQRRRGRGAACTRGHRGRDGVAGGAVRAP